MTKTELINQLNLEPHPSDGGYFRRTYCSNILFENNKDRRSTLSSIYYMLTDDSPVSYLHKNNSDIIHYFHAGDAITYYIVNPEGQLSTYTLGNNINKGQQLQLIVKGGCWKASRLTTGEYGLISEAVSPGFDYQDHVLASQDTLTTFSKEARGALNEYIRK